MKKSIIVYYSRADENYVSGQIKTLRTGNTQIVAETLQKLTGAALYQIEQQQPYAKNYNECIKQAREDQNRNARPVLKGAPKNMQEYDVIYLGYPNYWGTMPMAVFTFLEDCDLSGKTIKPFCTHEGSGMGSSVTDIKKLCPEAVVEKGLAIRGANAAKAQPELEKWI